jgi:hypothetical protein
VARAHSQWRLSGHRSLCDPATGRALPEWIADRRGPKAALAKRGWVVLGEWVDITPTDRRCVAARAAIAEHGLTFESFAIARAACDAAGIVYARVTAGALMSDEVGPQFVCGSAAIELQHCQRADLRAIVSASAKDPGRWQLTWVDDRGPSGDTIRDTFEQAIKVAVDEGYRVLLTASPPAAGDAAAFVIEAKDRRLREIEAWLAE